MKLICHKISVLILAALFSTAVAGCGGSDSTRAVDPDMSGQSQQPEVLYSVGGLLEGLADGNSVVLLNNGSDDLTLTADGEFAFSSQLNDGDSYQVTVGTQPDDCHCTVENGSGTVAGADVTSVVVRCRRWTDPQDLADNISPDGSRAEKPQVAVNDDGEAVLVWRQRYDGVSGHFRIFKAEYRNGQWSAPQDLADNISPYAFYADNPQVAINSRGDAVIVWQQYDNGRWQIFKLECRNGSWEDPRYPVRLSLPGQHAYNPQVAVNDDGDVIVVWQQYNGGSPNRSQIFKAERRNGLWLRPADLDDNISPDGQNAQFPQVAINSRGDAVVVWQQYDGHYNQIFKSERRNGTWTHPDNADLGDNISPDGQHAYHPQVAIAPGQEAVIVWEQRVSSLRQVVVVEYRDGSWSDFSYPLPVSQFGRNGNYYPQVAMNARGDAVVAWRQWDGANWQIFRAEYRDGRWIRPDGPDDNISPDGQDASAAQVAMDANGSAVIVWQQSDGGNDQIFRAEYRDGAWTEPVVLDANISPDGQDATVPRVAVGARGDAVIVWQQSDGGDLQIFKSEYR